MDDNSLSVDHFETKYVGFVNALKWLIYKNFKQQFLRRPLSLAFKLLCPALCVIILGLIRLNFTESSSFIYYPTQTNDVTPLNIQSQDWIDKAICFYKSSDEKVFYFILFYFILFVLCNIIILIN